MGVGVGLVYIEWGILAVCVLVWVGEIAGDFKLCATNVIFSDHRFKTSFCLFLIHELIMALLLITRNYNHSPDLPTYLPCCSLAVADDPLYLVGLRARSAKLIKNIL